MDVDCREVVESGKLIIRVETRKCAGMPCFVRAAAPDADSIDDKSILETNDICVYGQNELHAFSEVEARLKKRALEQPKRQRSLVVVADVAA